MERRVDTTIVKLSGRRKTDLRPTTLELKRQLDEFKISTRNNFNEYHVTMGKMEEKQQEQHNEVIRMLEPVYKAFSFNRDVDIARNQLIIKWTRYIGLGLSVVTLIGVIWAGLKFGILLALSKVMEK